MLKIKTYQKFQESINHTSEQKFKQLFIEFMDVSNDLEYHMRDSFSKSEIRQKEIQKAELESILTPLMSKFQNPDVLKAGFTEDMRTEFLGIKLGDIISGSDIIKLFNSHIYDKVGYNEYKHSTDGIESDKKYTLKFLSTDKWKKTGKYELAIIYSDYEHVDRVNEYVELIKKGIELPPIIINSNIISDGSHRLCASLDIGRKKILAFVS